MRAFLRDLSTSTVTAGLVSVLVGFTSSIALVFQGATALGATPAQIASWVWALGIGMGVCSFALSLRWRVPVMVAYSTPGAAVLATAAGNGFTLGHAIFAFIVSGALVVLVGVTGWFEKLMNRIPMPLANGLLAGVLARFALDAFLALKTAFVLVLTMVLVFLLGRRFWPRSAVPVVLLVGVGIALAQGRVHAEALTLGLTWPVFMPPEPSWQAVVGLALPIFVVTMASQNLPGVAAIRAAGYQVPVSKVVTTTGAATVVLAPFGGFAFNLAAITAAICLGREAHEDPARRYTAAAMSGVFYFVVGVFGVVLAGLLAAFPKELVLALAGIALLNAIASSLSGALKDEAHRDPAALTFLVTLSGVSLWGVGSAFWGVLAGALAMLISRRKVVAV